MNLDSPEYQKLLADVSESQAKTKKTLTYSNDVLTDLTKITQWTDDQAQFLANICVTFDEEYGVGRGSLCLDWFLDHYIAFDFERNVYPLAARIYWMLRNEGHHYQNKYNYFNEAQAYYIPHDTKKIYVCGQPYHDRPTYLVIDDTGDHMIGNFFVRQIWSKTTVDCIGHVDHPTLAYYRKHKFELGYKNGAFYGDCRDNGHVLTYQIMSFKDDKHGKCDHTIWDINSPLRWFFECNSLHTELTEEYPDELE